MYKYFLNRQYVNKNKSNRYKKDFYIYLENRCINELKNNKLDLFYDLLDSKLYNIYILIDGKEDIKIENICHFIDLVFVNNIQNKSQIIQTLLLVDIDLDDYYFMTNDGTILGWNKTIKRNQIGINYKDIQLDPYLLLSFIDEKQIKVLDKLTNYSKNLIKNLFEIIATYILIFCYMCFQIYLLFKSVII
jgi:hypothetical protein